jgi:hypothetical protein
MMNHHTEELIIGLIILCRYNGSVSTGHEEIYVYPDPNKVPPHEKETLQGLNWRVEDDDSEDPVWIYEL